jgi:hypothetical protein
MHVAQLALIFMAVVCVLKIRWILNFKAERDAIPGRSGHCKPITHGYPWRTD